MTQNKRRLNYFFGDQIVLELGKMLDEANALPIMKFSDRMIQLAVNAQSDERERTRYLAVWAWQVPVSITA